MVKKQLLIFAFFLALFCSIAYAGGLFVQNIEPKQNLTSTQVTFKCYVGTSASTDVIVKYKKDSWTQWTGTAKQTVSSSSTLSFVEGLSTGNWIWACNATCLTCTPVSLEEPANAFSITTNTAPAINPVINDQNKSLGTESWILNLEKNKQDIEDPVSALTWTISNVDNSFCEASINKDIAEFKRKTSSAGSKTYTITLTDSGGLSTTQDVKIIFYSTTTNNAPTCSTIPEQSWTEGDSHTLNLGSYCSDSDSGQTLIYKNVSAVSDIMVSISGSSATFSPSDDDWAGTRSIRFNVSDGIASILTNEIALTVTAPANQTSTNEEEEEESTTTTSTTETTEVIILTSPVPSSTTVSMILGEKTKFKVRLRNSIDDIIYSWYLDDVKISGADSSEYEFEANEKGSYELKAEASKGSDSDFRMWIITVNEGTNETGSSSDSVLIDLDISNKENSSGVVECEKNEEKTFTLNGNETHKFTILNVTDASATVKIESEPIEIILNIGESRKVDLDSDGVNDIKIKLNSITDGKARITLMNLKLSKLDFGFITGFSIKDTVAGNNKWYLTGTVCFIVLLLIILKIRKARKKQMDLTHFEKRGGILRKWRRKLAERELRKRQKKQEQALTKGAN